MFQLINLTFNQFLKGLLNVLLQFYSLETPNICFFTLLIKTLIIQIISRHLCKLKYFFTDRIVDDMNTENKLTRRQLENLLDFEVTYFLK